MTIKLTLFPIASFLLSATSAAAQSPPSSVDRLDSGLLPRMPPDLGRGDLGSGDLGRGDLGSGDLGREDPARAQPNRPGLSAPQAAIAENYPEFLETLEIEPSFWLPSWQDAHKLFTKPARGTSGVYIDGKTAVAQFGHNTFPEATENLLASGFTTWRSPERNKERLQALNDVRRQEARSVSDVLNSEAGRIVQAEFRPFVQYRQINTLEESTIYSLERAARLLAEHFELDAYQFRASYSGRSNTRRTLPPNTRLLSYIRPRYYPTTQLQKRSGILNEIDTSISNPTNITNKLELYQNTLNAVQSNISNLLFPFFDTITAKTNNDIVYDILWSVFQDLIGGSNSTGPFLSGWNCLDMLEQQYLNHTNSTHKSGANNSGVQEYLAVHQVILDIYDYAWTNGSAVANQTGLLDDIADLSNFALSLNQSALPADLLQQATPKYDYSYFRSRNPDGRSNTTYFNFTLPQWG